MSQFKEDTEINVIAQLPLVQPTEDSRPDLDLNPDHRSSSASKAHQVMWLCKCISPPSHRDNTASDPMPPPEWDSDRLKTFLSWLTCVLSVSEQVAVVCVSLGNSHNEHHVSRPWDPACDCCTHTHTRTHTRLHESFTDSEHYTQNRLEQTESQCVTVTDSLYCRQVTTHNS